MKLFNFLSLAICLAGAQLAVPADARADDWDCGLISDGPPGICPDCIFMCAQLGDNDILELAIEVDETQDIFLCSVDLTVKQGGITIYEEKVYLDPPLELEADFYELDPVELEEEATTGSLTVITDARFAASALACE